MYPEEIWSCWRSIRITLLYLHHMFHILILKRFSHLIQSCTSMRCKRQILRQKLYFFKNPNTSSVFLIFFANINLCVMSTNAWLLNLIFYLKIIYLMSNTHNNGQVFVIYRFEENISKMCTLSSIFNKLDIFCTVFWRQKT